jgi:DNA polymerase V
MKKVFALVDCNNFYASCERMFDPKLNKKPIVILSNNDGCIISRSNEAKAIGIPMGVPVHEAKNLIAKHDVAVFSSNFTLYGDISDRVMSTLRNYSDDMEIYSIDEAFLNLTNIKTNDYENYCRDIVVKVKRDVGIPTSIGIAPTKTLAKLANKIAKKNYEVTKGAFDLDKVDNIDSILEKIAIIEVWGIGYRNALKLNNMGIYTVLDFKRTKREVIKANLGVIGERTHLEINGTPCVEMETPAPKKMILTSRSFGKTVFSIEDLKEAVATFVTRGSEKLRSQGSLAGVVIVSLRTKDVLPKYGWGENYTSYKIEPLEVPTDYTPDLINAAFRGLEKIFVKGLKYKKAAVVLSGIIPKTGVNQMDLFGKIKPEPKKDSVMKTIDSVNKTWGREVIKVAATGIKQSWIGRKNSISKRYTTEWGELLEIKI